MLSTMLLRWLCLILSLGFFILGSMMLIGGSASENKTNTSADWVFLALFAGLPYLFSLGFWYISTKLAKKLSQVKNQEIATRVVQLLQLSPVGRLTVADLMADQALNLHQAKTTLDQMVENEILELELAENGSLSYRFRAEIGRQA